MGRIHSVTGYVNPNIRVLRFNPMFENATSIHALQRAIDRASVRLSDDDVRDTLADVDAYARATDGRSVALICRPVTFVGHAWSDVSNGDRLVAIIRDRRVVTFMFRRSSQPFTPFALRVDAVGSVVR